MAPGISLTPNNSLEIDFLAVGEGKKSGDAIALRYGNLSGPRSEQTVVIIDGGTKDSGQRLVEHVRQHYGTTDVDIVFSTHGDIDHVSGLTVVLEGLTVKTLSMHQPWNHAPAICNLFEGRPTTAHLSNKLQKALSLARELEGIAKRRGIPIVEPFAGVGNPVLKILGPSKEYYQLLLADFEATPDSLPALAALFSKATEKVGDVISYAAESLNIETLTDEGVTSSENNSSVILLVQLPTYKFLFTADAGIPALSRAADYASSQGWDLSTLDGWQIPHHGSKRNVGPTILKRIKGKSGFISVGPEGAPKHPAKKVTNALIRRGSSVYATQGTGFRHHHNAPPRDGWNASVTPIPFYDRVEI
jgi:beta-lactamase superfamily II metal-dependent hydrolase